MTTIRALRPVLLALGIFIFAQTSATTAHAQDANVQKEAGVHFQRAVQLYSEADYRAALVEFKRAYELAPNVTVLYNLGETYYQLQQYAEALTTFERFLAEGGTQHKQEVENAVSVLKTRVGKLDITTPSPGWDLRRRRGGRQDAARGAGRSEHRTPSPRRDEAGRDAGDATRRGRRR